MGLRDTLPSARFQSPELVRLLIEAGADPNSEQRDRNPMQALIRNFEWSLDSLFLRRDPRATIECLKIAGTAGGRWRPTEPYHFRSLRRAIAKIPQHLAVGYLREFIDCGLIEQNTFAELMRTPRMKQILQSSISGAVRFREFAGIRTRRSKARKS